MHFLKSWVFLKNPEKVKKKLFFFFSSSLIKKIKWSKPEIVHFSVFLIRWNAQSQIFIRNFFSNQTKKKQGKILSTYPKLSYWWSWTIRKNWSWKSLLMFCLMKIIALTIQMRRTSPQLVTPSNSPWKETLSHKIGSSEQTPHFLSENNKTELITYTIG